MAARSPSCRGGARAQCEVLADRALALINAFRWLTDVRIARVHVDGVWQRLPARWRAALEATGVAGLAGLVSAEHEPPRCWPLSLLAFVSACRAASISRALAAGAESSDCPQVLRLGVRPKKLHELSMLAPLIARLAVQLGGASPLLVVDVGAGQGHLSALLAHKYGLRCVALDADTALIQAARRREQVKQRMLARTERRGASVGGSGGRVELGQCELRADMGAAHLHAAIDAAMHAAGGALAAQAAGGEGEGSRDGCLLVGLHTCGDLAPTLIRLAKLSARVRAVVSVGCCYQRCTEAVGGQAEEAGRGGESKEGQQGLEGACRAEQPGGTAGDDGAQPASCPAPPPAAAAGYPMSEHVRAAAARAVLGSEARGLACHEAERYATRLATAGQAESGGQAGADGRAALAQLRLQGWRAALESAAAELLPSYPAVQGATFCQPLGYRLHASRADSRPDTFAAYARSALGAAIGADEADSPAARAAIARAAPLAEQWLRVVAIFALRQSLAAVCESLLLADRLLFLAQPEQAEPALAAAEGGGRAQPSGAADAPPGWEAELLPLFDPAISPRTLALVATRCAEHSAAAGEPALAGAPTLPRHHASCARGAHSGVAARGAAERTTIHIGRMWTTTSQVKTHAGAATATRSSPSSSSLDDSDSDDGIRVV